MLRDITLGQYYQTESVIHKMDPRVKLGGTLLFIISLFFFKNYAGYVIAALFLGMVIRLSKVPFRFMVEGNEDYRHADDDHGGIQSVSDTGHTAFDDLEADHYAGRSEDGHFHGNPPDTADHWILCDDTDHHAEQSDGWYGENDGTLKSIQGART